MSYDHLYRPELCSAWPVAELRAVSAAYRDPGGRGLDGPACLEAAVDTYLAAGGGRHGAARAVQDMVASLSREHGDWLWGAAQVWRHGRVRSDRQPAPFEPPADEAPPC